MFYKYILKFRLIFSCIFNFLVVNIKIIFIWDFFLSFFLILERNICKIFRLVVIGKKLNMKFLNLRLLENYLQYNKYSFHWIPLYIIILSLIKLLSTDLSTREIIQPLLNEITFIITIFKVIWNFGVPRLLY